MVRLVACVLFVGVFGGRAVPAIMPFSAAFHTQMVATNGTSLSVRVGGQGPAVVRWHFNFRGPDEERLVQGRERIYLDRLWNGLSADPKPIDESTRQHYAALCARPHAIHDAFEQFGSSRTF